MTEREALTLKLSEVINEIKQNEHEAYKEAEFHSQTYMDLDDTEYESRMIETITSYYIAPALTKEDRIPYVSGMIALVDLELRLENNQEYQNAKDDNVRLAFLLEKTQNIKMDKKQRTMFELGMTMSMILNRNITGKEFTGGGK